MNELRDMIDWFAKRTGGAVQSGSRNHMLAVLDIVTEVDGAMKAMVASDELAALKCVDRMIIIEREADRIEDALCREIVDGSLKTQQREDLLHFVKKTDKIADWANSTGTYIQMIVETQTEVPKHLWEAGKMMAEELLREIKLLIAALENMGTDDVEVRRSIEGIKDQERIIDQMHYNTFKKILTSDMEYRGVILMQGVVNSLEEAADACKSCADTLMVMTVARSL